ncbi:MAG TPA: FAD-dependent oxidoreductase [Rectinema sp.]|nr:pyridine nucleotide-disulfide oxidoreductase [Spirochaetaceae bacterium]HNY99171.1 FAD-dependent oxidoreductase [Rectinema sp.]HOH05682.1 FAD-dependent oxidoreductase [Rectinema sp.]HRC83642.1 FAD-dependent oxidoreductase [Rectinema sp.]
MARYIIVGGVAGGASTAARLRRLDEQAEIVLFERGPYISYANCGLPYYAGETIKERERLFVMTPEKFNAWLNVDVRIRTEVTSIDREAKKIRARELDSGREYSLEYNALVLSPGAEPIKPPIPGIEDPRIFTLRSVSDIDHIKEYLDTKRPERIIVVGGGFIGLEMAENLHARGSFVTIVEALDQVMNPIDFEMAALVHQHLKQKNVELYLSSAVLKFEEAGSRIVAVLADGTRLDADMIVLSIGVRPETAIAKAAGLETTPNGAILVNENLQTSDPAIYALGDAIAFPHPVLDMAMPVPLAGPANKQARVVADNIAKGPGTRKWHGAIGTSIAKVFDITVAAAGVAEKLLRRNNIPCISIITHGSSHASYYPGAQPLTIKTIFTSDGTLLGAQVVGYDGVDKRIDLIADYIRRKAKVTELGEIEHAYAPPFSSAKDPVNIAGMVAENVLAGLSRHLQWHEVKAFQEKGGFVLDVRTPEEFSIGAIPGAKNIPLDSLRQNLGEIPQDREVLIYCGVGLRGYLAERILRQNGWTSIANLSGGYKTWEIATEPQSNKGIYKPGFMGFQSGLGKGSQELLHTTFAEGSGMPESFAAKSQTIVQVDACGLQCPGPIMRLKTEIDKLPEGGRVVIRSTDPGFVRDAGAWCKVTGNLLISMEESNGTYTAMVEKTAKQSAMAVAQETEGMRGEPFVQMTPKGATIIVFSNDFDRALASFVLANGAAAAGKDVTMFFTFWGLSVIRKPNAPRVAKDFMGRMFGMMLPKHAGGLSLSHMNFGGIGPKLMKSRMKSKNIDMLETMMSQARQAGVHFIACQMSMDIMGVKHEELLDGVEVGGVATYMEAATEGNVNLFI